MGIGAILVIVGIVAIMFGQLLAGGSLVPAVLGLSSSAVSAAAAGTNWNLTP